MTVYQRRRKQKALDGKAAIIAKISTEIEIYQKFLLENSEGNQSGDREMISFLRKKRALHEKERETLRERLS